MSLLMYISIWFLFGFLTAFIVGPLCLKINNKFITSPERMNNGFIAMLILSGPTGFFVLPIIVLGFYLKTLKCFNIDLAELINKLWKLS